MGIWCHYVHDHVYNIHGRHIRQEEDAADFYFAGSV